jgi:glyoxylate/hydroxypyruvate reductase
VALLIVAPDRDTGPLVEEIRSLAPEIEISTWPGSELSEPIDFAVVWQQPPGLLGRLKGLKAVSSLGAGVEHLLTDPDLPDHVAIGRLAGPRLAANMAAYLVGQVIKDWKRLDQFSRWQAHQQWRPWAPETPPLVGLLGLGAMGSVTATAFQALDIPVAGYTRSGNGPKGLDLYRGEAGLHQLAQQADYLICLLPLTPQTRGILNGRLFSVMKPGSMLINVGRGEHLVEPDLIPALDAGRPARALLDVFTEEPLPEDHRFWTHPAIRITPHCASITLAAEAAELIVASYRQVQSGHPPLGLVDRQRVY